MLDGQDSALTTTAAREDRTYGAYEAHLALYKVSSNLASIAAAINHAATNHYDIILVTSVAGTCGQPGSAGAVKSAWDNAYAMGAFGIVAAGNSIDRELDDCSVNGIATRSDILVVGAEGDDKPVIEADWLSGRTVTPISSWILDTQPLMGWHTSDYALASDNCPNVAAGTATCPASALGGAPMNVLGTVYPGSWTGIHVIAPSGHELSPVVVSDIATYASRCCGTSYAAAHAAAVAVSLVDALNSEGIPTHHADYWNLSPNLVHLHMLLMGDGARGGYNPGAGPTSFSSKDRLWGAGRLRARLFTPRGLDEPSQIVNAEAQLSTGESHTVILNDGLPLSDHVGSLRAAMTYEEPNLDPSGDPGVSAFIYMQVKSANPVGGTCASATGYTVIAYDSSRDTEKIIAVRNSASTPLASKCVIIVVTALYVPPSPQDFRSVGFAAYYESLDREAAENLGGIE